MSRLSSLAIALALVVASPAFAAQADADAETLIDCVSRKAGPEGDLPPAGPLRDKFLKEMEGGTQACVGLVAKACAGAGGDRRACARRETAGWLKALARTGEDVNRAANLPKWTAPAKRIRAQAASLCEGAAAMSAWGYERVKTKGRYGEEDLARCIMKGVAQQALLMLEEVRGN